MNGRNRPTIPKIPIQGRWPTTLPVFRDVQRIVEELDSFAYKIDSLSSNTLLKENLGSSGTNHGLLEMSHMPVICLKRRRVMRVNQKLIFVDFELL